MANLLSSPWSSRSHLPPVTSSNPSPALSLPSPCPLKQGACCDVVTRRRGQLHGRFSTGLFSALYVQSASICHCFPTVPPGKMGLILQSISRRAAFVLPRAPRGPICFTALSLKLHFTFCLIYVLMVLHLVMLPLLFHYGFSLFHTFTTTFFQPLSLLVLLFNAVPLGYCACVWCHIYSSQPIAARWPSWHCWPNLVSGNHEP